MKRNQIVGFAAGFSLLLIGIANADTNLDMRQMSSPLKEARLAQMEAVRSQVGELSGDEQTRVANALQLMSDSPRDPCHKYNGDARSCFWAWTCIYNNASGECWQLREYQR